MACLAWYDKAAKDEQFVELLPLAKSGANDERNYIKKAVSWALRNIGKRNSQLNDVVLRVAEEIGGMDSRAARWIASDVLRELSSQAVRARLDA